MDANPPALPRTAEPITQFDTVVELLAGLDWNSIWNEATDTEKRTLLDEFVPAVNVFADHLEVEVRGAPTLNVALREVGLRNRSVETASVGGPIRTATASKTSSR